MAAEVSAGVRLTVDALNVNTAPNGGVTALTINHENQFYHAPIQFSISGEKAGGTLKLTDQNKHDYNDKGGYPLMAGWDIWFKPIDMFKVEVGDFKITLNQEKIDWYRSQSAIGNDDHNTGNLKLTLEPVEGLSFDAMVSSTWGSAWFKDKKKLVTSSAGMGSAQAYSGLTAAAWEALTDDQKDAYIDSYNDAVDAAVDALDDPEINELGFMMHYGADFGTVSAMFSGNKSFKELKFGAGYAGSVDPLSFFVNVLGFMGPKFNDADKTVFDRVRVEAYAETTIDALSAKFWVPFEFDANCDSDTKAIDKIALGFLARLDYTVGDYTLFLQAGNDSDFITKDFSMGIKPGVKFSVGECEIEAAVDISAKKDFSFSVPVSFKVAF
jgi:hypothetical protein